MTARKPPDTHMKPGPKPRASAPLRQLAIRIDPKVWEYLDTQPNKTRAVEEALMRTAAFRRWVQAGK